MIVHYLLQWVGYRAPQRLGSCGIFLPSYRGTFENPFPDVEGIGFSLFMGTASPLMIYLEMWHIILLSQSSFLSDKLLNEGIYFMVTSATYSVTEFSSVSNIILISYLNCWFTLPPKLRSVGHSYQYLYLLTCSASPIQLWVYWKKHSDFCFCFSLLPWNENEMQHSCPFWPFLRFGMFTFAEVIFYEWTNFFQIASFLLPI